MNQSEYIQSLRDGDPITVTHPETGVTYTGYVIADVTKDKEDCILCDLPKLDWTILIFVNPTSSEYGCAFLDGGHWIVHIPAGDN